MSLVHWGCAQVCHPAFQLLSSSVVVRTPLMMRLTARRVIAQERLETQSAVLGVLLGVAEQKKLKTGAVGYGQLTDFFLR